MKIKVIKRFHDMVQKKIREKDETMDVSEERGRYLISQGMAEEYTGPEAAMGQRETKEVIKTSKGQKEETARKGQER